MTGPVGANCVMVIAGLPQKIRPLDRGNIVAAALLSP
jgi:hypothetical protein